jgi:hypothetical protein
MLRILLVHGMGRTPLNMWRLARALRQEGHSVELFGYVSAVESIDRIVSRLSSRLQKMAGGDYVVIGHSLGGVLLRMAIGKLDESVTRPRRLIMLGSPNHSPRLARTFAHALWFRALNGDAGRLLADEARLMRIAPVDCPCTIIAGTRGIGGRWSPFHDEPNDGLVAVAETELAGNVERFTVPAMHPFLMNNAEAREIIATRCRGD